MASYYCDHETLEGVARVPADWYIIRLKTRKWHGKEAIEDRDFFDKAYSCCDACLGRAINTLVAGDPHVVLRVRALRGQAVEP